MARTQTMSIKEFMNPVKKELKVQDVINKVNDPKLKALLSSASVVSLMSLNKVFAQPEAIPTLALGDSIKGQIVHAFDPLIVLTQTLAYPIAAIMISAGCLFIMIGNKEKGVGILQMAGIGYILVQLSPLFLKILVSVGSMTTG